MMTECERIIAEGILPESFFEEEVRDGFLVTRERKKIWAIELDLLLKFDEICRKHDLTYFLNSGSLLGAVRHHGFIPWDDDIDVEMPRKDYEALISISGQIQAPYFLQTPMSDPDCFYSFAKFRNSNTTGSSEMFAFQEMNHGIYIDVFPFDNWDEKDEESFNYIRYLNVENSTYMRMKNPNLDEANQLRVSKWSGINPLDAYQEIHQRAQVYNAQETKHILIACSTIYTMKKKLKLASDYEYAIYSMFEGFSFPIPNGYERILTSLFGNYMEFPPVEKRGTWHSGLLFDPDVPYSEYLKTYRESKRKGN